MKSLQRRICSIFAGAVVGLTAACGDRESQKKSEPPAGSIPEIIVPLPEVKAPEDKNDIYVSARAGAAEHSRFLTEGETRVIKSLFGTKISLACVRLHFFSKEDSSYLADVPQNDKCNIEFYGNRYQRRLPDHFNDSLCESFLR